MSNPAPQPAIIVVTSDPADARRVEHALQRYDRELRRNGARLPSRLRGPVTHALAATDRQRTTTVDLGDTDVDGDDMTALLIDYRTAGQILGGLSERTVQRLVSAGAIPVVRIGGRARIRPEDLRRYVDTKAAEQASTTTAQTREVA